jgi:hypothetical protein
MSSQEVPRQSSARVPGQEHYAVLLLKSKYSPDIRKKMQIWKSIVMMKPATSRIIIGEPRQANTEHSHEEDNDQCFPHNTSIIPTVTQCRTICLLFR